MAAAPGMAVFVHKHESARASVLKLKQFSFLALQILHRAAVLE